MELRKVIDGIPRRYRPLASLPSAAIIAKLLLDAGILRAPPHAVEAAAATALAASAAAGAVALLRRGRPSARGSSMKVRVIEVITSGAAEERVTAAQALASIVKERAKAGRARYAVISTLQGGFSRTLIGIMNPEPVQVDIEAEILKTLISMNVRGARLSEPKEVPEQLLRGLEALEPMGRGEPVVVEPSRGSIPVTLQGSGVGGLALGTAFEGAFQRPVELTLEDIRGHIAVFGSTGTGKTTTLATVLSGLPSLGVNFIALDWAGELSKLIDNATTWSPINDGGINPFTDGDLRSSPELLLDVLSSALDLTQPQSYIVMRVFNDDMPRSFRELKEAIESYPEEARWDRDVKRGLMRKVAILANSKFSGLFNGSVELDELESRPLVVKLDEIESFTVRKAYALVLLAAMFARRTRERPVVVAIDEAHNLFNEDNDLVGHIMAESRKYGLYVALATQSPSAVPNSVLLNANTKVVHALRSLRDKEVIAQSMNLPYDMTNALDKLEPGEAIVQSPTIVNPVIVKVKLSSPRRNGLSNPVVREPVNGNANSPL
ncbi:MAG: ATP-binding protein [Acidilobus sp.]